MGVTWLAIIAPAAVAPAQGAETAAGERKRWQVEVMSQSQSELGGYKEVIARIAGAGAYSVLKFESGGHRVQRVPATETQGRIHTSACTVAVLQIGRAHV